MAFFRALRLAAGSCILSYALALVSSASDDYCLEQERPTALLQASSSRKRSHVENAKKESVRRASGLHGVVGPDGVLMIGLDRLRERFNYSHTKLAEAGINATLFRATDGTDPNVSQSVLDMACRADSHMAGCATRSLQALVESHRRAWLAAQERASNWTLILEDDGVPVFSDGWDKEFDAAWAMLPPNARFVRLGRCVIKSWLTSELPSLFGMKVHSFAETGQFRVTDWTGFDSGYDPGCCTHAYIVHKSIIPDLLSLIPCSCPLDCCMYQLFRKPGQDFLYNIDTKKTPDEAFTEAAQTHQGFLKNVMQFGIIRQAWDVLPDSTTGDAMKSEKNDSLSLLATPLNTQ